MKKLRILIADDHEMVRRGLKSALTEHPGWEICGEAHTGREAVALAEELKPDVVVMDISMPELNGLEATRKIRKAVPRAEVLILTMHDSEQLIREVLTVGARGYVLKNDAGRVLVQAVEALSQRKPFFTSAASEVVLHQFLKPEQTPERASAVSRVTPREREILQLIAEGRSNKEVATALDISVKTAETHRTNLMRKLHLHSAADLTRYAIRNKIIEP